MKTFNNHWAQIRRPRLYKKQRKRLKCARKMLQLGRQQNEPCPDFRIGRTTWPCLAGPDRQTDIYDSHGPTLVPQGSLLRSPHFSGLKSVKNLGRWGSRNFCPCVAPAVGRGQWSYPSWPDADALLHWMWCTAPLKHCVMGTTDAAHTECWSHF